MKIKAIETRYKGCRFRSRLEARWAVFFDHLGVKWEYEKEGFNLGEGDFYLPDFWLPEHKMFVEIKPDLIRVKPTIYLAGKVYGEWRNSVITNCNYGGPNFDHDCASGHGGGTNGLEISSISIRCMEEISSSCILVAWIDERDCYGTLAEIGYARGIGKQVFIGVDSRLHKETIINSDGKNRSDFWFITALADKAMVADCVQDVFDAWFPMTDAERKCAKLSEQSRVVLCSGNVGHGEFSLHEYIRGRYWFSRNDWMYIIGNKTIVIESALNAARSARFEFGECG